jgi:hypothetical protein
MALGWGTGGPMFPSATLATGEMFLQQSLARTGAVPVDIASFMSGKDFREKTSGANESDRMQVDFVARKFGIDRRDFGGFIEETKARQARNPSDNFSNPDLEKIAQAFKEQS